MPERDLVQYQYSLRQWAAALLGPTPSVPVLVRDVCKSLGVRLRRSDTVPRFKAYLSIDPSKDNSASILLPPEGEVVGNFERLCVAHELAHYFLLSNYELLPKSNSEYWQHEELCDDFARHLLIPENYVRKKTKKTPLKLRSYLALCREISSAARVPWIHAAIRLTETNPHVIFLRCSWISANPEQSYHSLTIKKSQKDKKRSERIEPMFVVKASSLPRQKGIRTLIKPAMPLYSVFDEMLRETGGRKKRVQRDITAESKSSLTKLLSVNAIAFAETEGGMYPDIKIIIGSPKPNGAKA